MCARVTLSGEFVKVDKDSDEYRTYKAALVERHPSLAGYPDSHDFNLAKIDIHQVWLVGMFGGADIMTKEEYLGVATGATLDRGAPFNNGNIVRVDLQSNDDDFRDVPM